MALTGFVEVEDTVMLFVVEMSYVEDVTNGGCSGEDKHKRLLALLEAGRGKDMMV